MASSSSLPSSPPSSFGGAIIAKKTRTKKSTLRVVTEILTVLLICEMYFYHNLALRGDFAADNPSSIPSDDDDNDDAAHQRRRGGGVRWDIGQRPNEKKKRSSPELGAHMKEVRRQFYGKVEDKRLKKNAVFKPKWEKDQEERRAIRKMEKREEKLEYLALMEKHSNATDDLTKERLKTARKLAHMQLFTGYDLEELPPWSRIEENFGIPFADDDNDSNNEPIILGLEHCESFRKAHDPRVVAVGPAGLFSTGTNLINTLTRTNCKGPANQTGIAAKFALIQAPYGKHNPADARFHHQVKFPKPLDRDAVLPVVAIRHPYTWMSAMCKHSYGTRWRHVPHKCWESLFLKNPVSKVPWGFKMYNDTHPVPNSYESLAHMWVEWYKPYFLEDRYGQTPRLMVRHEDMVYRPEKVVSRICECVGGTNPNDHPDWTHPEGFQYEEESANKGKGHGKHGRSGLLTAVIKYATPLEEWYSRFTASDRTIMKDAFLSNGKGRSKKNDDDEIEKELRGIFDAFGYKLFDDVSEPSDAVKKRNKEKDFSNLNNANDTKAFKIQQNWNDGPPPFKKKNIPKNKDMLPSHFG